MKELTLGNGQVFMRYKQSIDKFPVITFGNFIDTSKSRKIGTNVSNDETIIEHLALNFTKTDSLVVLKKYIKQIEEFLLSEEDYLQSLVLMDYYLTLMGE